MPFAVLEDNDLVVHKDIRGLGNGPKAKEGRVWIFVVL